MHAILIPNIIPLYLLIFLGYVAGKKLEVDLTSVARIVIFIVAPVVFFGAIARIDFHPAYALLPVLAFVIGSTVASIAYLLAGRFWRDNTANLIGGGCVAGNTGYFGLPIVMALFEPKLVGVYLMMNVGLAVAEITVGYFIAARGTATLKESLGKVLTLPSIYGFLAGLLYNFTGLPLPEVAERFWTYASGTWVFLGMMLIGIALSRLKKLEVSWPLIGWMFSFKFILWPSLTFGIVFLDAAFFHVLPGGVYRLMAVMATVPLMANIVAYAAHLKLHPERAATAVLMSTLFALIYMPLALGLFETLLEQI